MNCFLLPHQDDEYGVYPLLEDLARSGEPLAVVYLTSGTLDGSISTDRNTESERVLNKLGIFSDQIHFMGCEKGFPDGQLPQYIDQAYDALDEFIKQSTAPSAIYCPAWEGGHQDHDAAFILACRLAQEYDCVESSRQFPMYTGAGLPWILWHTFYPLRDNGNVESQPVSWRGRARYLRLSLSYRSQWRTWLGLFPPYLVYQLFRGKQLLQPINPLRLAGRPHPGTPLYERRGFCTTTEFRHSTGRIVEQVINC